MLRERLQCFWDIQLLIQTGLSSCAKGTSSALHCSTCPGFTHWLKVVSGMLKMQKGKGQKIPPQSGPYWLSLEKPQIHKVIWGKHGKSSWDMKHLSHLHGYWQVTHLPNPYKAPWHTFIVQIHTKIPAPKFQGLWSVVLESHRWEQDHTIVFRHHHEQAPGHSDWPISVALLRTGHPAGQSGRQDGSQPPSHCQDSFPKTCSGHWDSQWLPLPRAGNPVLYQNPGCFSHESLRTDIFSRVLLGVRSSTSCLPSPLWISLVGIILGMPSFFVQLQSSKIF